MTYQEFKNTYKNIIKKYPETTNLYNNAYKIIETITNFDKVGNRWKETDKKESEIDYIYYFNVFDAVPFFRNLGGTEKINLSYTFAGHIPDEVISISPNRTMKTIRTYQIERKEV